MKKSIASQSPVCVALIAVAVLTARAQEPPEVTPPVIAPTTDTNLVETTLRDPFWPVGYVKQNSLKEKEKNEEEEVKKTLAINWPRLNVVAVSKSPKGNYFAMLKDIGIVEEGDVVKLRREGLIYRWKITTVNERGIGFKQLEVIPADQKK